MGKAARAQSELGTQSNGAAFDRLKDRVNHNEAVASAEVEMVTDDMGDRLLRLERDTEVERLLSEMKNRRQLTAGS
jgi:phage shock protein A